MTKDIKKIKIEEYNRFSSLMAGIQKFVDDHQAISYIEFDYYVVHNMTLFSIEPNFDFEQLEKTLEQIKKALPAIKRIFSKPIIILKDTDDVLPVENARIINQNTFLHLANHSQHVSNLTKRGVKPRKLLTRLYEDDYSIYENIIFCNTVDDILSLIKKNRRTLENLLYASDIMRFNLLEKVNHVKYFLALGKLHTGYIRDFKQYVSLSRKLLHELSSVNQTITPRLYKPVYQKNKKRNKHLKPKKTNIFLMQKDYRQVYKTSKYLLETQAIKEEISDIIDFDSLSKNYLNYVLILAVFASGHFNFELDPEVKMNLRNPDIIFKFKDWTLNITNNDKAEVFLSFSKEKTYKIMLTNSVYENSEVDKKKKAYSIDEIIRVSPFEKNYLERDDVFINMEDIDSFRRLQQIILKGMIYSDSLRKTCPFCGEALHQDPRFGFYQCQDCMIQIKEGTCQETHKTFFYTENANHKKHIMKKLDFDYDEQWFNEKQNESYMYYRNITKINQNGEIICPHCNNPHIK
jgi:ribosomal protein L37AE/L43A